ncbi:hypothetical protein EYC84_010824 [Monilinia fructicola]|uniref:Replication factor C C-terminal domain-containing protein n=1 Tax=Monilinia fructicola TaxID=38448 RepID=A0A5M9J6E2_MONFR|nr:hypothetical protein EYC84_010824 [Monilinia fructicola]
MALIVDKHRPRSLDQLTYHDDLSERLRSLAQSGDFPHLLLYGPSGAGKKNPHRLHAQRTLRALGRKNQDRFPRLSTLVFVAQARVQTSSRLSIIWKSPLRMVFLERVAKESGRNLRRALLMYEAAHAQNETITDSTPIPPPDWEALLSTIAHSMTVEHTPAQILKIRAQLYDLLTHCIPATTILKTLTWKLMPLVDDALKSDIVKWAAFYEHRCKTGTKLIFHLEAFVAKFMRVSEEWLMAMEIE